MSNTFDIFDMNLRVNILKYIQLLSMMRLQILFPISLVVQSKNYGRDIRCYSIKCYYINLIIIQIFSYDTIQNLEVNVCNLNIIIYILVSIHKQSISKVMCEVLNNKSFSENWNVKKINLAKFFAVILWNHNYTILSV